MKLFMSDVSVSWLTGGQNKLSARTGLSCEERVAGGGSAWSVKRFGSLCTSAIGTVSSGGGRGVVASRKREIEKALADSCETCLARPDDRQIR
jgi:hypothetical protein